MIALDTWREQARAWLASVAPEFAQAARAGFTPEQDLAAGRRYQRAKFDAGFAGIHWSPEFGGQGLTPLHKVAFEQEEMQYGMPHGYFGVSLGIPVPVIMQFAPDKAWAKERVLAALKGEEIWCQLFSEPSGGSDLAGARTRVEADYPEQSNGGWTLNGQKLWTTWAQHADYGIIIARSDPGVVKHKGLTFFWLDMHVPGITVRPIKLAAGDNHVNEVFFDDVRLDDAQRLGAVGGGFGVAMAALMIERYTAGDPSGYGPPLQSLIDLARETTIAGKPAIEDGRIRSAIARAYAMRSGLEAITARAMLAMEAGAEPGPEGALNKLVSVRSRQKLSELASDLRGTTGFGWDPAATSKEDWVASWLTAPTLRIAGGADEMLLNTIAERILGLPQDHRPDKGVAFNQIPA